MNEEVWVVQYRYDYEGADYSVIRACRSKPTIKQLMKLLQQYADEYFDEDDVDLSSPYLRDTETYMRMTATVDGRYYFELETFCVDLCD